MSSVSTRKIRMYDDRKSQVASQYLACRERFQKVDREEAEESSVDLEKEADPTVLRYELHKMEDSFDALSYLDELLYERNVIISYLESAKLNLSEYDLESLREMNELAEKLQKILPIPELSAEVQSLPIVRRELQENAREAGKIFNLHEQHQSSIPNMKRFIIPNHDPNVYVETAVKRRRILKDTGIEEAKKSEIIKPVESHANVVQPKESELTRERSSVASPEETPTTLPSAATISSSTTNATLSSASTAAPLNSITVPAEGTSTENSTHTASTPPNSSSHKGPQAALTSKSSDVPTSKELVSQIPSTVPHTAPAATIPAARESTSASSNTSYTDATKYKSNILGGNWSKEYIRCIADGYSDTRFVRISEKIECIKTLLDNRLNINASAKIIKYLLLHYGFRNTTKDAKTLNEEFDRLFLKHQYEQPVDMKRNISAEMSISYPRIMNLNDIEYGIRFRKLLVHVFGTHIDPPEHFEEFKESAPYYTSATGASQGHRNQNDIRKSAPNSTVTPTEAAQTGTPANLVTPNLKSPNVPVGSQVLPQIQNGLAVQIGEPNSAQSSSGAFKASIPSTPISAFTTTPSTAPPKSAAHNKTIPPVSTQNQSQKDPVVSVISPASSNSIPKTLPKSKSSVPSFLTTGIAPQKKSFLSGGFRSLTKPVPKKTVSVKQEKGENE